MNWQETLQESSNGVIRHESGAAINGPNEAISAYDMAIGDSLLICGIPSTDGVQRLLEEFDIASTGWIYREG